MSSWMLDQKYLRTDQYRDASNLNARVELHTRFRTNEHGWMRWAFDQLHLPSGSRILELGCGPGTLWSENAARIPESWEVTLSDVSPGMLEDAKRSLVCTRRQFRFLAADMQTLPLEDSTYDVVMANHMLYHVPDVGLGLSEARRVLKPRGRFYAATNGQGHLHELIDLVRTFDSDVDYGPGEYSFSLDNGTALLTEWFEGVSLSRYEDSLRVTEAEPLVAYILSSIRHSQDTSVDDWAREFTHLVEAELAANDAIHISKEVGLFEAHRGSGH